MMRRFGGMVLLITCAACTPPRIDGIVYSREGEGLPGVAITIKGTSLQALSNTRGEYRLPHPGRAATLVFNKSGYQTAEYALSAPESRRVVAPDIRLWRLPAQAGVYLYKDNRYRDADRRVPERVVLAEGDAAWGTRRLPAARVDQGAPLILCYHTPRYDTRITRLQNAEARVPGTDTTFDVLVPAGTTRTDLVPIGGGTGELLQLQLPQSLEPGFYAVHWGALEGFTALDERMYAFTIEAAPEAASPEASDTAPPEQLPASGQMPAVTESAQESAVIPDASPPDAESGETQPVETDPIEPADTVPAPIESEVLEPVEPAPPSVGDALEPDDDTPSGAAEAEPESPARPAFEPLDPQAR